MTDEEEAQKVRAEFPAWQIWRGVNHVWYARLPRTSPPKWVKARDPQDLRPLIQAEIDRWNRR